MFNGHFFGGEQNKKSYDNFLRTAFLSSSNHLAVVLDPPFGGLVEPIVYCLRKIQRDWSDVKKQCGKVVIYCD